jgi:TPR repeat protein
LFLAAGCVIHQNGRVLVFPNTPVVVLPVPAENYQVQNLKQRALQGNAIAQFTLGSCYANGRGVVRDYAEAAKWYRLSAEQGCAAAQNRLGVCYSRGLGVAHNYAEAVAWYCKAAEQGNAFAEDNLGACYSSGHGVARDFTKAVKWYRLSAEQGNAVAQNHLGVCYYNGRGVVRDYAEAVKWYRKAAAQGNVAAKNNLFICERTGLAIRASEPNGQTAQNPPAEPNEAPAENALTADEIKELSRAGVKADTLIAQIKTTNSRFSAQDIAIAQQAEPPLDPSVIKCMKDNVR